MRRLLRVLYGTIRGAPIRVRRVVVVGVACRVDVPRVVAVAAVRRTQAAVLSFSLHPCFFFVSSRVCFLPCSYQASRLDGHAAPVDYSLSREVKNRLCNLNQAQEDVALYRRILLEFLPLSKIFRRLYKRIISAPCQSMDIEGSRYDPVRQCCLVFHGENIFIRCDLQSIDAEAVRSYAGLELPV